jgi:hypothetical protein
MMSASIETITGVQPNSPRFVAMTKLTAPDQNGDLAVTVERGAQHLQAFSSADRRSVTPEVAGSSPVAPASWFLTDAGDWPVPC